MNTVVRRAAFRGKEEAKIGLRRSLHHFNLDLVRDPFSRRVAATLSWLGIDSVLDVGANIGQYARSLRSCGFDGRILSFEPMAAEHRQLAGRSAHDPRWTAVHLALGAKRGQLEINVSANSYSSSLLPMARTHLDAAPDSVVTGTESVLVSTVDDVVERYGIDPERALLKIDTQGYEAMVLDGASRLLGNFRAVQLELSYATLYEGQPPAEDLIDRLTVAGFALHALDPGLSDPATGRMLQADGLFVRLTR